MNKLIEELERLYFLHGQQAPNSRVDRGAPAICGAASTPPGAQETAAPLALVSSDGRVRTLVVNFRRSGDWEQVAALYQGVQNDLNFPAPAVSVSGDTGYALWFSLAEAVPVALARSFLDALRIRYLTALPAVEVDFRPDGDPSEVRLPPAINSATGKWSTFIDPSLGRMFVEEPWLDMAPNLEGQADLLAGLKSVKAGDFQQALVVLAPEVPVALPPAAVPLNPPGAADTRPGSKARRPRSMLGVDAHYGDPESFLLAVMNDPTARARHRIAAARALLPCFRKGAG